jgi:prepilin-type N-terminal cleavage/methylation domain-containing protein
MLQNIKKRNEGFTIIEVLIVLAIAGLILLVVFLAVPALQRNSRNQQRRTDAGNYLSAVNEWISNNAGKVPVTGDLPAIASLAKLSSMKAPAGAGGIATTAQTSTLAVDTMQLVTGAKCDNGTIGNSLQGSGRQFALRYSIEDSAGNPVKQCLES